ncbi:MAG: M20 family metallopeptidase [Chloroflexi bacterium]|nr:M20 family metallopeptidase [Chloroflexota bacterium]
MDSILDFLESSRASFLADLAALVNVDCGTYNKAGVDWVGEWIGARCHEWGWEAERLPQTEYGDCWIARLRGDGAGRLMLVGHTDTVYPDGTAAGRPMRFDGPKILGPGTCDMKGGLLVGMYALRALQNTGFRNFSELVFFFNSEEEVGSPVSRPLYSPVVREMDAALVLESARANGDIVSARKGVGEYTLRVKGKAAHAGVEPEKGASAVLELAHRIVALHALNSIAPGVTLNAGVIGGATRPNVVPEEAWVTVDVRAVDPAGAEAISAALAELAARASTVPRTQVEIAGYFGHAPMAKTPAVALLAKWAKEAARDLGFEMGDAATGGASDANAIAGLGVPVLDGLGPVGGLDHSPDEYIEADSLAPRTALLAGSIRGILERREKLAEVR